VEGKITKLEFNVKKSGNKENIKKRLRVSGAVIPKTIPSEDVESKEITEFPTEPLISTECSNTHIMKERKNSTPSSQATKSMVPSSPQKLTQALVSPPKRSPRKVTPVSSPVVTTPQKSPRKPLAVSDVLSGAKANFLSSIKNHEETRLTNPSSPTSPSKSESVVHSLNPASENLNLLSPASLNRSDLCSPPAKKSKAWKSKWQMATLNGSKLSKDEAGKKKKVMSEAQKLQLDEGVINMLNRVPSVYGEVPVTRTSGNPVRPQRAQSASLKQKIQTEKMSKAAKKEALEMKKARVAKAKMAQATNGPEERPDWVQKEVVSKPMDVTPTKPVKLEHVTPKDVVKELLEHLDVRVNEENIRVEDKECYIYMKNLPLAELEKLKSSVIRYALPTQGKPKPVPKKPSESKAALKKLQQKTTSEDSRDKEPQPLQVEAPKVAVKMAPPCTTTSTSMPVFTSQAPPLYKPTAPSKQVIENRLQNLIKQFSSVDDNPKESLALTPNEYGEIFVRFYDHFAQITFAPTRTKLKGSLSPAVIEETIHALTYIAENKNLRGVVITGVGNVFCQGVDLCWLQRDHADRRTQVAVQLAAAVERLVRCMAGFPKLLVAAVNGVATGLGVTMLPLFDIVYANDKASFNTWYSRLGQIPEGAASATLPHLGAGTAGAMNEMLLMGRHLTATESVKVGLVTQTFFPGRLMEEVIPRMKTACCNTTLGLQWNKLLLKQTQQAQVEQAITGETALLTDMWSSKEFHTNLLSFINTEKCLVFQRNTN